MKTTALPWRVVAATLVLACLGLSAAAADDERGEGKRQRVKPAGSNAALCAQCHKDGRSGRAPHPLPSTASRPAVAAGNAAVCAKCHTDGRSGKAPHAIPTALTGGSAAWTATVRPMAGSSSGTAVAGTSAGTIAGAAGNATVCAKCHTDGRSGKAPHPLPGQDPGANGSSASSGNYVIIGWDDLGMHCLSPRFAEIAILPPSNDLMAQVIRKGNPPRVVSSGVTVKYELINNTTVTGKTDFWQYVGALFGVRLAEGVGLTGSGLSGAMKFNKDHYEASAVPALPYDDAMRWNPYQKALLTVSDKTGTLASTTIVVPVSDEMNCAKCHGAQVGTMESNILTVHDKNHGTQLMNSRPVACASCHADNALGAPGARQVPSLSAAMHGRHANLGFATPACYDCHPGARTRCNRSKLPGMGPEGGVDPKCENCHGDLKQVAYSAAHGRVPWLNEPNCAQCHGGRYATGSLYRRAKGHGGLYCSACHNSPHAWYPTNLPEDNAQPIALQGKPDSIGNCAVCHTSIPSGRGPHG